MRKGQIVINVEDVIGKRLGKLEVISYAGHKMVMTKGGGKMRHYYLVKCDCENYNTIRRSQVISGNTKSCGCERKIRGGYDGN